MRTVTAAVGAAPAAQSGRLTARVIQVGLGLLWLLDGVLQLQSQMFGPHFADNVVLPTAQGQPGVISSTITHAAHLIVAQPALADATFAGIQILIGLGLLIRHTVRPALALSLVWGLGVWALGEGFGLLFTGKASPLSGAPGAALLYVAIGLLVWPRTGPAKAKTSSSAASEGPLGERGGQAIWAVVWSGLGVLWLLPANRAPGAVSGVINGAVTGEPGWVSHVPLSAAHALSSSGGSVAVACGVVSFAVGLGPLVSRHVTPFLVVGSVLALGYWLFGEAFGGLFTGLGTDPNTGPPLILLALTMYPCRVRRGADAARARHRALASDALMASGRA